jgi:cytoskeletal protein CcmA (bactofilin family)
MSAAAAAAPVAPTPTGVAPPSPTPVEDRIRDRGSVRRSAIRARRWELRGIAKVVGPVEVGSARLDGTVAVGGPLAAVELTAVGTLEVRGPVSASGTLTVRGGFDAGAIVRARDATFVGPVRAAAEVVVDGTLRVRGSLRAPLVRCGRLEIRGTADLPGTVTATDVDLDLRADSTLGSIVCRRLRLRGPTPTLVDKALGQEALVVVNRVEAETATISGARVGFVRATEVVLGPAAHVGAVEGRVVRAHPTSRVGPESWSRPPEGLRR